MSQRKSVFAVVWSWLSSLGKSPKVRPEDPPPYVSPQDRTTQGSTASSSQTDTEGAPPFDPDKKRIIKAIMSVIESGTIAADYGAVTVLDDKHGITYGSHQATDGGESSLDKIVARYIELGGEYATELQPFMERLKEDATTAAEPGAIPGWVRDLMGILELAGDTDPLMAEAQEEIFETYYWAPAFEQFEALKLTTPMAMLVCYDSTIQSGQEGIGIIRRLFTEVPPSMGGDERAWVIAYLEERRSWLLGIPHAASTVYRIDSMLALVDAGNWNLDTPVHIQKPKATIT